MRLFRRLHERIVPQVDIDGSPMPTELSESGSFVILVRIAVRALRGLSLQVRARHVKGPVLVGRGARIFDAHDLTLGRRVKIEEDAEIQCRSARGIVLGDGVTIGRGVSIRPSSHYGHRAGEGLTVGAGTAIGALSWIGASGHVTIGSNVLIGPRVTILPENHDFARTAVTIKSQGVTRERIFIEDDCWIGASTTILAGVRIGRGSVVAAGAVVARDVAPFSIVGGVPARLIKERQHASSANRSGKAA